MSTVPPKQDEVAMSLPAFSTLLEQIYDLKAETARRTAQVKELEADQKRVSAAVNAELGDLREKWNQAARERDRLETALHGYVIIANGEGAQAAVIADGDLHEAVHKFMCCCGKPWKQCECGPSMIQDIALMDDPDEWTLNGAGDEFCVSWPHETGRITLYKLAEAALAPPAQPQCIGFTGRCFGNLGGEEHEPNCPMAPPAQPEKENK